MNLIRFRNAIYRYRWQIALGAAIFLGLVFLISGVGKLPGQTDFAHALLKSFWTPAQVYVIAHFIPWIELVLGLLLIAGILPRIVAILCMPLIFGFIANNAWAIINGIDEFPKCECFGIFEQYIGYFSPIQSLVLDIALLICALLILVLNKDTFFSCKPWFLRKGNQPQENR